jgi:dTDP-glucose pyrophosphorylase
MDELFIAENESILQALKQLDKSGKKILFVHNNGKLLATITDGDIRRWILNGGNMQESIKNVANYHPKYLYEEQEDMATFVIKKYSIDAIPIVNRDFEIKRVIFMNGVDKETKNKFKTNVPVVIMAGGKGTRLHPYTNILPKPLIPVGDLPIAEHIINNFREYGCNEYYMIVNYKRNMIKSYFDELDKDYLLKFINEETVLGTGGGLSLLKGMIQDTFILTNCDILIDDDMTKAYECHKKSNNIITMVCSLQNFTIPYGVVKVNKEGTIQSIQEKPEMSFFTNTGCYIVEPEVVDAMNYNEPIDFPDIIKKFRNEGKKVGIYPIGEHAWLDMGQLDELENMKNKMGYQ